MFSFLVPVTLYWYDVFVIIFTCLAQVFDYKSTKAVISLGGKEKIPFIRWLMQKLPKYWWIPKYVIGSGVGIGIIFYTDGWPKYVILLCYNLAFIGAIINNYLVLKRLREKRN